MYILAGLSEPPGVPWHPQILADQLTLSQPRGADYAHQIMLAPGPGFSDLSTALNMYLHLKVRQFGFLSNFARQITMYSSLTRQTVKIGIFL